MDIVENKKVEICAITTISKTMDWFVCDIMRKLSENGYEITLVSNMDEDFAERNGDYAHCIDFKMSRGVSIKDLIIAPLKMRKIFKQNKFDVVYYMSPNASMYAALGGWLARVPVRIYSQTGLRYVSFSGIKRSIFRLIEKFTCMLSTHVKAQSPQNRQFAIEEKLCKPDKISVVGIGGTTGVLLEQCDAFEHDKMKKELRKKYRIPTDAFLFGYVGRVNADKGISELLEAFENVQAKHPNAWLVLVGMIDDTNPISEEQMQHAKKNQQIVFTGNVQANQVYQHMAMFDVLVHPTYREGFGKVLQEAMGMRLPIITTSVPGPSEVVEDGVSGILVEAKNSLALRDAMLQLYEGEELRISLAQAGRTRAEKFFDRPIMLRNQLKDINEIVFNKHA